MTLAMPPGTITDPAGYVLTATAEFDSGGTLRVVVRADHTPAAIFDPAEQVMLWVGGVLVDHTYAGPSPLHVYTWSDAERFRQTEFHIPRGQLPSTPGPVTVLVGVWRRSSPSLPVARIKFDLVAPPYTSTAPGGIISRSFFMGGPDAVGPNTIQSLADGGVNTLEFNAFQNPGDNPRQDFEAWRVSWDGSAGVKLALCRSGGMKARLTGDDLMRNANERAWLDTCPWAEQAVRYMIQNLHDSGVVLGVELLDEVNLPPDDPVLVKLLGWWRSSPPVPISFPAQAGPTTTHLEPLADYRSRYASIQEWREYSDTGLSVWEWWQSLKVAAAGTAGKPFVLEGPGCGEFYDYPFPAGTHNFGSPPDVCLSAAWLALALGACGIRWYALDTPLWSNQRAAAQLGSKNLQTGTVIGSDRWNAIASSHHAIAAREAILIEPAGAVWENDGFAWGSRPGLDWAVNLLADPRPSPLTGVRLTAAGEVPVSAGNPVPSGGVVLSA